MVQGVILAILVLPDFVGLGEAAGLIQVAGLIRIVGQDEVAGLYRVAGLCKTAGPCIAVGLCKVAGPEKAVGHVSFVLTPYGYNPYLLGHILLATSLVAFMISSIFLSTLLWRVIYAPYKFRELFLFRLIRRQSFSPILAPPMLSQHTIQ